MKTYAFIDASNLFYGGEKSLGWKIDYKKLKKYLEDKYQVSRILYFGGVETHTFHYDYMKNYSIPLKPLEDYLSNQLKQDTNKLNDAQIVLIGRHLQRIRFYLKLEQFGYELYLKPVKLYDQEDGTTRRKANCDVEMAYYLMLEKDKFSKVIVLSGDGDFLPLLKHMRDVGKEVIILARGKRTAREIRQFAGSNFRDFVRLESHIKLEEK